MRPVARWRDGFPSLHFSTTECIGAAKHADYLFGLGRNDRLVAAIKAARGRQEEGSKDGGSKTSTDQRAKAGAGNAG
jgi:hypothetical protein